MALALVVSCFGCTKAKTTASKVDTSKTESTAENSTTSDEGGTTSE